MESVQNATEVFDQVTWTSAQGCWCWPRRWTGLIDPRGAQVIGDDLRRERIQQGLEILSGRG
ncbi:MAG: hypothetical protein Ct9H300mP1_19880 [Planctomycetaceae bacterium]|nr:MAG: hypothetical protein Ct9H300mP1_19880 [Planctomycetaceae bacterium]